MTMKADMLLPCGNSMRVPVVNVWEMRVAVPQLGVGVPVAVFLAAIPASRMVVLMVFVVNMFVAVYQHFVDMLMIVFFSQMQPHAQTHQSRRNPEWHRCGF